MKRSLFMVVFLLIFVSVTYGEDYTGTLKDAQYKIRVPENWNGVLLMYAHGYGYIERYNQHQFDFSYADAAPGGEGMENFLLSQGYALAGTTFSGTGWQVKEGMHEIVSLAGLFNGLVGKPKKIILIGYSMGGVIALKSAEEVPLYDGIIAGCTPTSTSKLFDLTGAGALAYDAAFGWPESWGTWYDVRDNLTFSEVASVISDQLDVSKPGFPTNFVKFEFMRRLFDTPDSWFYTFPNGAPGLFFFDMFFLTEGRAELEMRAKGPIVQNADHVYVLSPEDRGYLNFLAGALGVSINFDSILTSMNSRTTVTADKPQRHYLEKYFDPSGELQKPVITIHSTNDVLVPEFFETVLAETVETANKKGMLLQVFTADPGHCTFTPPQLLSTIRAMEYWLEYGTKPGDAFFPESFPDFPENPAGFKPLSYTPGPWPIGKK